ATGGARRGGEDIPGGQKSRVCAARRFRAGHRGEEVQREDHGAIPCGGPGRPARGGGRELPAQADRPDHVRVSRHGLPRRGRPRGAVRARRRGATRRQAPLTATTMASSVRVFIASSLDGFIAGPGGDLSWLPAPPAGSEEDYGWGAFSADSGCLLMGPGTYAALAAMGPPWPHPDRPTIIATTRALEAPPPAVEAARGGIEELIALARERAGGRDVDIDGGDLIRQALDAGLVDEMIVTLCPVVLGAGHPLDRKSTRLNSSHVKI